MKNSKKCVMMILFLFAAVLSYAVVVFGAESTTVLGNAVQGTPAECTNIPAVELPMPGGEADKNYLGISGTGNFKMGEIKTQVLIVEVFSFYCPHCQRTASQVNGLYEEIQRRGDLNGRIKMIGIGAKNSPYEVDSYRDKYHVPFPLFPDKDLELTGNFCVKGTPTFIGFKVDGKGSPERFYFGEGGFQDTQKFLSEIIQASGLK